MRGDLYSDVQRLARGRNVVDEDERDTDDDWAAAFSVECPDCDAGTDERCTTRGGLRMRPHPARLAAAAA